MKNLETYANAIFQNANVGMQSINDILPKVTNEELINELKHEYEEYEKISQKLKKFAISKNIELKENNIFEKAKMWLSVNMSTLTDNSTRHIAEMLLLGTIMGTTTCYKDLYDHQNCSDELDIILQELEELQEDNFNKLKEFLKNLN